MSYTFKVLVSLELDITFSNDCVEGVEDDDLAPSHVALDAMATEIKTHLESNYIIRAVVAESDAEMLIAKNTPQLPKSE